MILLLLLGDVFPSCLVTSYAKSYLIKMHIREYRSSEKIGWN